MQKVKLSFVAIGYGNTLRSDDAIGPLVAEAVEGWGMPNVDAIALHQLTPELADTLQNCDVAIFIDACIWPELKQVQVQAIEPAESTTTAIGHTSDPQSLLALTKALYGHLPLAWMVTVPAANFELGETLSTVAKQGITDALKEVDYLINHHQP